MIFTVLSVNVFTIVNKPVPLHFITNEIQEEKSQALRLLQPLFNSILSLS